MRLVFLIADALISQVVGISGLGSGVSNNLA
jgi:hypothetical protein